MSERRGDKNIHVMNADGSSQKRLTTKAGNDFDPDWGVATT
jgi:Tol biopolymer transport system component